MYHLYVAEMEAKIRRADTQREMERLSLIQTARENGNYETSGWLPTLTRRLSGLTGRVYRRKAVVTLTHARVSPC